MGMIAIGAGGVLLVLWGVALFLLVWRARRKSEFSESKRMASIVRQERRALEMQKKRVRQAAYEIRHRMIESLVRQEFTSIKKRQGAVVKYNKPRIRTILYSLDEIWLRIDRLPRGSNWTDLLNEDYQVLENLRMDVGRKECQWVQHYELGLFLRVFVRSSIAGIPALFMWDSNNSTQTAMKLIPASKKLAIPLGIGENRLFHWIDLSDEREGGPHLLIAGTTGGGKSNTLNQALCTLIRNNSQHDLRFCMIDLKRVELSRYDGIPHLWQPIVKEPEEVSPTLQRLKEELNTRYKAMESIRVSKIKTYNSLRRPKFPYLIIVVDEWGEIMRRPNLKKEAELLLTDLASLGRAAGIFVILCTQRPSVNIVTGDIKANFPARLCLRMPDRASSMTILDNGMASDIEAIPGRAVYFNGGHHIKVQVPFISDEEVESTVRQFIPMEDAADPYQILVKTALEMFFGKISVRQIYEQLDGAVPRHVIERWVTEWEYKPDTRQPIIKHNETSYILSKVRRKMRGGKPYWLIPVKEQLPATATEVQFLFDSLAINPNSFDEEV